MAAVEKFKKLGYKRIQNNKYRMEYLKIDTKYWGEYTPEGTEVHQSITFDKQFKKSINLKSLIYSLDIEKKRICNESSFSINKDLLEAINEQFSEL